MLVGVEDKGAARNMVGENAPFWVLVESVGKGEREERRMGSGRRGGGG